MGILQLQERRRVALFVRRDAVGRFATCLVRWRHANVFDAALSDRFAAISVCLEQPQGDVGRVERQQRFALGQSLYA